MNFKRRIERLEKQKHESSGRGTCYRVRVGSVIPLALSPERCEEILRECGFLTNDTTVVNLCGVPSHHVPGVGVIPDSMTADELEKFLREHGSEICGPRAVSSPAPIVQDFRWRPITAGKHNEDA